MPSNSTAVTRRQRSLIGMIFAAILLGVATPQLTPSSAISTSSSSQPKSLEPQEATGTLTKGTPDFETILPAGKTIQDYGGWTRVSPSNRDPVYAYVDKIGEIPITISQQPLPKDFASEPDDQIRDLALGYGATKTINVSGTTVYLGTSAKGPQSVIFGTKTLLVLVKASAEISEQEWQTYIQSLQS